MNPVSYRLILPWMRLSRVIPATLPRLVPYACMHSSVSVPYKVFLYGACSQFFETFTRLVVFYCKLVVFAASRVGKLSRLGSTRIPPQTYPRPTISVLFAQRSPFRRLLPRHHSVAIAQKRGVATYSTVAEILGGVFFSSL